MNGPDVILSNGDDYQDGMRGSPELLPRRLELKLSPSPAPQVTEVRQRPPNSASSPTRERVSNRRKLKPSLGDAVLIRFMTGGRDPDIANFEADREFSDSDEGEDEDDEGAPKPEPEEVGNADSDDEPDERPRSADSSRKLIAAPETRPTNDVYAEQMTNMSYDHDLRMEDSDEDEEPLPQPEAAVSPPSSQSSPAGSPQSRGEQTLQERQDAKTDTAMAEPRTDQPPVSDEIAALAVQALDVARQSSKRRTSPVAATERKPLPDAKTDRSAPRYRPISKRESPPTYLARLPPRSIASATSPGEDAVHSPRFSGDRRLGSLYAPSDRRSPSSYAPSTTHSSHTLPFNYELAPYHTRPRPLSAIPPIMQNQDDVKLSPITSDHSGGHGTEMGGHERAPGNGTASSASTPKTTTTLPSFGVVFGDLPDLDLKHDKKQNKPGSSDARPSPYAQPSPARRLSSPSRRLSHISSHATTPGPTSPLSTQYYGTSTGSSSYSSSRRSTDESAPDAKQMLPSIQQLRTPLPDASAMHPQPSLAPSLAGPANGNHDLHKRHMQSLSLAAKPPLLAPHQPHQPHHAVLQASPAPTRPRPLQVFHNQGPQGVFQCTVPGCTAPPFVTQYLLNSHLNVHSDDRPHYCDEPDCPRSKPGNGFKRKNEKIRHGLVHRSPGYVCPFCPDREHKYPRPDNLLRHVRAHHKDKSKDDPKLREVLAQRPDGPSRGRRRRN